MMNKGTTSSSTLVGSTSGSGTSAGRTGAPPASATGVEQQQRTHQHHVGQRVSAGTTTSGPGRATSSSASVGAGQQGPSSHGPPAPASEYETSLMTTVPGSTERYYSGRNPELAPINATLTFDSIFQSISEQREKLAQLLDEGDSTTTVGAGIGSKTSYPRPLNDPNFLASSIFDTTSTGTHNNRSDLEVVTSPRTGLFAETTAGLSPIPDLTGLGTKFLHPSVRDQNARGTSFAALVSPKTTKTQPKHAWAVVAPPPPVSGGSTANYLSSPRRNRLLDNNPGTTLLETEPNASQSVEALLASVDKRKKNISRLLDELEEQDRALLGEEEVDAAGKGESLRSLDLLGNYASSISTGRNDYDRKHALQEVEGGTIEGAGGSYHSSLFLQLEDYSTPRTTGAMFASDILFSNSPRMTGRDEAPADRVLNLHHDDNYFADEAVLEDTSDKDPLLEIGFSSLQVEGALHGSSLRYSPTRYQSSPVRSKSLAEVATGGKNYKGGVRSPIGKTSQGKRHTVNFSSSPVIFAAGEQHGGDRNKQGARPRGAGKAKDNKESKSATTYSPDAAERKGKLFGWSKSNKQGTGGGKKSAPSSPVVAVRTQGGEATPKGKTAKFHLGKANIKGGDPSASAASSLMNKAKGDSGIITKTGKKKGPSYSAGAVQPPGSPPLATAKNGLKGGKKFLPKGNKKPVAIKSVPVSPREKKGTEAELHFDYFTDVQGIFNKASLPATPRNKATKNSIQKAEQGKGGQPQAATSGELPDVGAVQTPGTANGSGKNKASKVGKKGSPAKESESSLSSPMKGASGTSGKYLPSSKENKKGSSGKMNAYGPAGANKGKKKNSNIADVDVGSISLQNDEVDASSRISDRGESGNIAPVVESTPAAVTHSDGALLVPILSPPAPRDSVVESIVAKFEAREQTEQLSSEQAFDKINSLLDTVQGLKSKKLNEVDNFEARRLHLLQQQVKLGTSDETEERASYDELKKQALDILAELDRKTASASAVVDGSSSIAEVTRKADASKHGTKHGTSSSVTQQRPSSSNGDQNQAASTMSTSDLLSAAAGLAAVTSSSPGTRGGGLGALLAASKLKNKAAGAAAGSSNANKKSALAMLVGANKNVAGSATTRKRFSSSSDGGKTQTALEKMSGAGAPALHAHAPPGPAPLLLNSDQPQARASPAFGESPMKPNNVSLTSNGSAETTNQFAKKSLQDLVVMKNQMGSLDEKLAEMARALQR
ncbi:unnamed protein product [Amoebophrya sp. A120]|nr:unnamed protein product [Amoebophrya sp. A120]|eukprot:GSA120T00023031001.1